MQHFPFPACRERGALQWAPKVNDTKGCMTPGHSNCGNTFDQPLLPIQHRPRKSEGLSKPFFAPRGSELLAFSTRLVYRDEPAHNKIFSLRFLQAEQFQFNCFTRFKQINSYTQSVFTAFTKFLNSFSWDSRVDYWSSWREVRLGWVRLKCNWKVSGKGNIFAFSARPTLDSDLRYFLRKGKEGKTR